MAQVLIVNCSSRADSNSRAMAAKVAEGAAKKGHSVETIETAKADIHPCIGCEACKKHPGKCVFDDAMTGFYPKILKAEVLIFSGPIYFFSVSAQMKAFLDRMYALKEAALTGKRVGAVLAYGDEDPVKSGCVNAIRMFQDVCAFCSAKWVGAMYGMAWERGDAAGDPQLLEAAENFGAALE